MTASCLNILQILLNARKYNAFLNGQFLKMADGESIFIKVAAPKRVTLKQGFRISTHTFIAQASINDTFIADGFGQSEVEIEAYIKAISESIERAVFRHLKAKGMGTETTNGWAIHLSEKKAFANAALELAERDAILVHWLKKKSMIEVEEQSLPLWLNKWAKNELSQSTNFNRLKILISTEGIVPTVTTALLNKNDNAIVSHSTHQSYEEAIYKALCETCRVAHFLETYPAALKEVAEPLDHARAYAYAMPFPSWFYGTKIASQEAKRLWKARYKLYLNNSVINTFKTVVKGPLTIGYAQSVGLQNLFFGTTAEAIKNNLINLKRLNLESAEMVNFLPHCIP